MDKDTQKEIALQELINMIASLDDTKDEGYLIGVSIKRENSFNNYYLIEKFPKAEVLRMLSKIERLAIENLKKED